jgi:uncharacterized cupin superfamily protein
LRADLRETEGGLEPAGEGWFIVNVADARSIVTDELGAAVLFEGADARFSEFGINIQVLWPGQPNAMYHGENAQEAFLVLSGECLLLIEEEEHQLRAWDFVHCPKWTEHVFVGAGDGPCAILMVGSRIEEGLRYPVSELALRHGAGVEEETSDGRVAYARFGGVRPGRIEADGLPWQAT